MKFLDIILYIMVFWRLFGPASFNAFVGRSIARIVKEYYKEMQR